jgi:hypothetical protein
MTSRLVVFDPRRKLFSTSYVLLLLISMATMKAVTGKDIVTGFKAVANLDKYKNKWIPDERWIEIINKEYVPLADDIIEVATFNNAIGRDNTLKASLVLLNNNPNYKGCASQKRRC